MLIAVGSNQFPLLSAGSWAASSGAVVGFLMRRAPGAVAREVRSTPAPMGSVPLSRQWPSRGHLPPHSALFPDPPAWAPAQPSSPAPQVCATCPRPLRPGHPLPAGSVLANNPSRLAFSCSSAPLQVYSTLGPFLLAIPRLCALQYFKPAVLACSLSSLESLKKLG